MARKLTIAERLATKFKVNETTDCWEWLAAKRNGYGHLWSGKQGKTLYAHRASYELHYGPIPAGGYICHRCDNRACINPNHLFCGTQADNMADMVAKGRRAEGGEHSAKMKITAARGSANGSAKLTESDVIDIRAARGLSQRILAERYGVSSSMIYYILSRRSWAHI